MYKPALAVVMLLSETVVAFWRMTRRVMVALVNAQTVAGGGSADDGHDRVMESPDRTVRELGSVVIVGGTVE